MPSGPAPRRADPKSRLSGIAWPAVPGRWAAVLLGMVDELESSQWLSPTEISRRQSRALDDLLAHARATVPYYRDRPGYGAGRPWTDLPILTRERIQAAGDDLVSTEVPADHLPLTDMTTSGTTGRPLTVKATPITGLFWLVCTLREHLWHGRDATATVVTLRTDRSGQIPRGGRVFTGWGPPIDTVYDTGPLGMMALQEDIAVQAEFLVAHNPAYLLSLPSNLIALCRHFARSGVELPALREVRSYGEALAQEVRDACREQWGVPVTDIYSSQELGYLAIQCPTVGALPRDVGVVPGRDPRRGGPPVWGGRDGAGGRHRSPQLRHAPAPLRPRRLRPGGGAVPLRAGAAGARSGGRPAAEHAVRAPTSRTS